MKRSHLRRRIDDPVIRRFILAFCDSPNASGVFDHVDAAQVGRLRSNSFSYSSTRTGFADCSASCRRSSLNAFDVGLDVQRLVSHRIDVLAGRARSAGKSVYDLH